MKVYNFDTEKDNQKFSDILKPESEIFKAVEKRFDDYVVEGTELYEMYFSGEDAIYVKKLAIQQAIESIFDTMNEDNLKFIDIDKFDLEASFE